MIILYINWLVNLRRMKFIDLYDISNLHYRKCTIRMKIGLTFEGSFVRFVVKNEQGFDLYPAEKLCFLPRANSSEFNSLQNRMKNMLEYFPDYIMQISLSEIESILIEPLYV